MKILVDQSACQGHARCNAVAAQVYSLDDDGFVALPPESDVPAGLEDEARKGAASCPERALSVTE